MTGCLLPITLSGWLPVKGNSLRAVVDGKCPTESQIWSSAVSKPNAAPSINIRKQSSEESGPEGNLTHRFELSFFVHALLFSASLKEAIIT